MQILFLILCNNIFDGNENQRQKEIPEMVLDYSFQPPRADSFMPFVSGDFCRYSILRRAGGS